MINNDFLNRNHSIKDSGLCREILTSKKFDVIDLEGYFIKLQKETGLVLSGLQMFSKNIPFFVNGPEHLFIRKNVMQFFRVSQIEGWSFIAQDVADQLLAQLSGEIDLVNDYAIPLSSISIIKILGLYEEQYKDYDRCAEDVLSITDPMLSIRKLKSMEVSVNELYSRFSMAFDNVETRSPNSFMSSMKSVSGLDPETIKWLAITLYIAGRSTSHTLSNIFLSVVQSTYEKRNNITDKDIEAITASLLRNNGSIQYITRIANDDIDIGEYSFKKGDRVDLYIAEASLKMGNGRCPFDSSSDEYNRGSTGVVFGAGMHKCIGQQLSISISKVAIFALLKAFPNINLVDQELSYYQSSTVKRLTSLKCIIN